VVMDPDGAWIGHWIRTPYIEIEPAGSRLKTRGVDAAAMPCLPSRSTHGRSVGGLQPSGFLCWRKHARSHDSAARSAPSSDMQCNISCTGACLLALDPYDAAGAGTATVRRPTLSFDRSKWRLTHNCRHYCCNHDAAAAVVMLIAFTHESLPSQPPPHTITT
jgi:hypothetical protein